MIEHVRRRALLSECFDKVVVATCDAEIADVVSQHGGKVVMTKASHPGALDRVAEVARALDCSHVVNIQGDEVLVLPEDLRRIVASVRSNPSAPAWNAVASIESTEELRDRAIVKLIVSNSGRVLFCARTLSFSSLRNQEWSLERSIWKSVGVMAYQRDLLCRYESLTRTPLEIAESIDQLRLLEHDIALVAVPCVRAYPAVNEHRELALVEKCLREDETQQEILQQVLNK